MAFYQAEDAISRLSSLRYSRLLAGRVEDWRGDPQDSPCLSPGFPPSCPSRVVRDSVSNPRHFARSVRISRTTRSCTFRVKSYGTYQLEPLSARNNSAGLCSHRTARDRRKSTAYSTASSRSQGATEPGSDGAGSSSQPSL